jgi:Phage integrase, N-terminal SAM-like domain
MVFKPKKSNRWWYKFVWNGELIRESTKQVNKRVAEQMEAAHRSALAKGHVGIRERVAAPKLAEFAKLDFLSFLEGRFAAKTKTLEYYRNGVQNVIAFAPLAETRLDVITSDKIASFIAKRHARGLKVSSINRELEVLRRMLRLALEWGKLEKMPPKIELLPGEAHRDRVLTAAEEIHYFEAAERIGEAIESAYERAFDGLRAQRGKQPIPPEDPFLLRDPTGVYAGGDQALPDVHIPPHLSDALGGTYGAVHAGLPGGPQRFCNDQALRPSASRNRARSHGKVPR